MQPAASDGEHSTRRLADIDLAGIAEALDDNGGELNWWYDPTNGQVEMTVADGYGLEGADEDEDEDDPYDRGLVLIEPSGSRNAYRDMVDFAESVADPLASNQLLRALEGRGAFRRFRDALYDFPDLRDRWFEYSNASRECRAIAWLLDERRVDPDDAEAELAARTATLTAVLTLIGSSGETGADQIKMELADEVPRTAAGSSGPHRSQRRVEIGVAGDCRQTGEMVHESVHVSTTIDCPAGDVYDFASNPANLSTWAAGLAQRDVQLVDGQWVVDSPMGRVVVAFAPSNDFGVLDHDVTLPDGQPVRNPMRVISNGGGCDVIFTVRRRPGMSESDFAADVDAVTTDLAALRTLMER